MEFIYVRANSDDRSIWTAVVDDDEYRIDNLKPEDIVLDIGMHTGAFCHRAWLAGSRNIHGFEADIENFRLAQANVKHKAVPYNMAVWRSDVQEAVLYSGHVAMEHELNTGVGNVLGSAGRVCSTIELDSILGKLGYVRLMKIDAEGSEWPILYTSKRLPQVQEIVGEWHLNHMHDLEQLGLPACTLPDLRNFLYWQGFDTRFYAREEDMPNPIVGNFRAIRKERDGLDPWRIGEGRVLVCG